MEWIKITLCATFFFFLTHCVLHAPCCPHIEAVHVRMSALGKCASPSDFCTLVKMFL